MTMTENGSSCKRISFGNMIACENWTCPYEWFDYCCVSMTHARKGWWVCSECVKKQNAKWMVVANFHWDIILLLLFLRSSTTKVQKIVKFISVHFCHYLETGILICNVNQGSNIYIKAKRDWNGLNKHGHIIKWKKQQQKKKQTKTIKNKEKQSPYVSLKNCWG